MKILCVYGMENLRIAFEAFRERALLEGHEVILRGSLKPVPQEELGELHSDGVVDWSDIVLVGMSSSPELSALEIEAVSMAQKMGKPYGFFIDVRGVATGGRDWYSAELRQGAAFVFLTEDEDRAAIFPFFPNARIITTGHPKYEENGVIKIPPPEVLEKLKPYGVSLWKTRMFIPGSKTPAVNVSALRLLPLSDKVQFIMGVHPGHPKDEASMSVYKEFEGRVIFLTREMTGLGAIDLIPAMNIYANIASTDVGRAATLRRECLQFETPEIVAMVTKNSGPDGFPPHEVKLGVSKLVRSIGDVEDVLRSGTGHGQYVAQEREYPKPPPVGTAVAWMLMALTK